MHQASTRILGIVGGTGPESTIEYYRSLVAAWKQRRPDGSFPRILINSIDGGGLWRLLEARDSNAVADALTAAVARLSAANAGLVILASNTVHTVFDEVASRVDVPMLSIVTETVRAAQRLGLRRPGILGTRFVTESNLYLEPLRESGMTVVLPEADERAYLHDRYVDELIAGTVTADTRARAVEMISTMQEKSAIDGVVLAGTELTLLFSEPEYHGLPVVDSGAAHVDGAITWLLRE